MSGSAAPGLLLKGDLASAEDHRVDRVKTVVAVLTYRRPDDLAEVLPLLEEQAVSVGHHDVRVLVVDNDPAAGGRTTVADHLARARVDGGAPAVEVEHVHEPRPGIAAARNRALAEAAAAGDDLLVFIDDDERPQAGWLRALVALHASTGAGAVVGPVVSSFPGPLDPWIAAGGFFDRRRLPTGTPVEVAATNNLLLDLHQLARAGTTFDERFGITGGSDTLFTRELHARGVRMLWCDEAVVTDVVPLSRATRSWVLRRALRSGNAWSRTTLVLEPVALRRTAARLRLTALGAARAAAGGLRLAAGATTGRPGLRASGLRTAARGTGMVMGAWGLAYAEYRRG
nr:glycosyltransferase [Quadrisphaera sp. RL12-1S]